jgi:hypothetical protein
MIEQAQPSAHTEDRDSETVADDILRGAAAIGREIGASAHAVYKMWAQHRLEGCWKDGGTLYGSKRALRRAHRNRARARTA